MGHMIFRWGAEAGRTLLYLVLGGALLVPLVAAWLLLIWPLDSPDGMALLWLISIPFAFALALFPFVRTIEALAARELLGLMRADGAETTGLYILAGAHLVIGATYSATLLFATLPLLFFLVAGERILSGPLPLRLAAAIAVSVLWLAGTWVLGRGISVGARRLLRPDRQRALEALRRRDALAKDLHDSLGHSLSVISVQAMAAQARLHSGGTDPAVSEALDALAASARAAQDELDATLGILQDLDASDGRDLSGLDQLLEGLDVELVADELHGIGAQQSRVAYRILQEGLTNALKHGCGGITIRVATGSGLLLRVVNNYDPGGRGAGAGSGVATMGRRAGMLGGTLESGGADGSWTLEARWPQ